MAEFVFMQEPVSVNKQLAAATASGSIVEIASGLYGYTKRTYAAGDLAAVFLTGVGKLVKGSTTFAIGDAVYWDTANKVAATSGSIRIGTALDAAASGDSTVTILFRADTTVAENASSGITAGDNIALLTDNSGGTASATIAAVGAAYSQTEVANAVASLGAKVNAILTLLQSTGVMAAAANAD